MNDVVNRDIQAEQIRQRSLGYTAEHDDAVTEHEFMDLIVGYAADRRDREAFVKIAALAVAAIESIDRRG